MNQLTEIFSEAHRLFYIALAACIIVFVAMIVDLCCGLYKARERGELRTSYGLSRSISKFIQYEGSMLIALGIDLLIHFSAILNSIHLEIFYSTPLITCIVGVFLLITEFLSIRESADDKTKKDLSRLNSMLGAVLTKEELKDIIQRALTKKLGLDATTTTDKEKSGE